MHQDLKNIIDPVLVADPPVPPSAPYFFLNGAQYRPPSAISSTFSNIGLSPSLHYSGPLQQEMGLSGLRLM